MIRNICITDCVTIEDYYKIVGMCENPNDIDTGYTQHNIDEYIKFNTANLFDNGDSNSFMHFWNERVSSTCTKMTVKEFYEKYDTKVDESYTPKEVLYNSLIDGWENIPMMLKVKDIIGDFFENNICIPKGKNPHPNSEVLHEYIENCTEDSTVVEYDEALEEWFAPDLINKKFKLEHKEPEYEYQWMYFDDNAWGIHDTNFYTFEEIKSWCSGADYKYFKCIEETKRERK